MWNTVNPNAYNLKALATTQPVTTNGQSTVDASTDVNDVSDVSGTDDVSDAKSRGNVQDAYGVVAPHTQGNVLSTQPPVPTDTTSVGSTSLRSAQSKLSFLSEGQTAGAQALSLNAENPTSNVKLAANTTGTSAAAGTAGAAAPAAAAAAPAAAKSSNDAGQYEETTKANTTTSAEQAQDVSDASAQAKKWTDHVGKKCKHVDKDMHKATGLPTDVTKQAYNLMKNANTTDYGQQIGVAMATLAQEKKAGSPSFEADKATVTAAVQAMTDNANTRGANNAGSTASVTAFDKAVGQLSSVTTKHLGSDPSGGAPQSEAFDPTLKPVAVNSWR